MDETALKLNSGHLMPIIGLGTWKLPPERAEDLIVEAVEAGVRAIDCAYVYENETEIGQGLKRAMDEGKVTRDQLFITTKLWNSYFLPSAVREGAMISLSRLGLDYVDLLLMHHPVTLRPQDKSFGTLADWKTVENDFLGTWKEMEKLVDDGKVKAIGVSNFNRKQIQRLLDNCRIPPAVNQIEMHLYHSREDLTTFCQDKGIVITAYSPFGAQDAPWMTEKDQQPLQDKQVTTISAKYKRSPAQILLRYLVQRGVTAVPKTVTPSRMRENLKVFDFNLSEEDMSALKALDQKKTVFNIAWGCMHTSSDYPFNED